MNFLYKNKGRYADYGTVPGTQAEAINESARSIANGEGPLDFVHGPRDFILGETSLRTAFPGHPGYVGSGDQPSSVPGTLKSGDIRDPSGSRGRDVAKRVDDEVSGRVAMSYGGPHSMGFHMSFHPSVYAEDESQSWLDTIGQRAYNSPRFGAALQDHLLQEDNAKEFTETERRVVEPHIHYLGEGSYSDGWNEDEGKTYSSRWDRDNMTMSTVYWKAHRDVAMGKYDHIEDEFEDYARNSPRAKVQDPTETRKWRPLLRRNLYTGNLELNEVPPRAGVTVRSNVQP